MLVLRNRWVALCARVATVNGTSAGLVFEREIEARYTEVHRAYHTLAHLEQCFVELDRVRETVVEIDTVELAIFFHDAIYSVQVFGENETKSAELAVQVGQTLGISPSILSRVRKLVLATQEHDGTNVGRDGQTFLDIDMSILGQDTETFDAYERGVRKEYEWVPEDIWSEKRRDFLRALLGRPAIFITEPFRERYEQTARANITRSIAAKT